MRFFCAMMILLFASSALADPGWYPERRRTQFQRTPGYIAVPFVYNMPGIGWGYGVLGAATNVNESCADISGAVFGGDVEGGALGLDSVHLLPERLIFDMGGAYLKNASMEIYSDRGMSSDKEDFSIAGLEDSYFVGSRLTLTALERRLETYVGYYLGSTKLASVRDNEGRVIVKAEDAERSNSNTYIFGLRGDFTDDYMDPRRGVRLDASMWRTPPEGEGPDYLKTDVNLTGYVPVGNKSTWAFNYFHSDSLVLDEGETDADKLAADAGVDCSEISDAGDRKSCENFFAASAAENKYGSASLLGGYARLRSYKEGRYRGAHTRLLGSELRLNLTDENTPFDIYVMRDIRTAIQTALFYEIGTSADLESRLWKTTRESYGAGLRIVTASGVVYRADLAYGDEGFQPSIFFQYPWEL